MVRKTLKIANSSAISQEFQDKLTQELAAAQSVSQGLRIIYETYRALDAKYSLQWLAQRAGVSSKGHLADAMSGRRPIRLVQLEALLDCLNLNSISQNLMKALFELGRCKKINDRVDIENKLLQLRKTIQLQRLPMPDSGHINHVRVLDVFSAFWLFKNAPSTEDLKFHFKRKYTGPEIDEALMFLLSSGAIKSNAARWSATGERIMFFAAGEEGPVKFIQSALCDAIKETPFWFGKANLSHFETVSISVNTAAYQNALKTFKDEMLLWQSRFENTEADRLVRFNVQLYPIE